VLSWVHPRGSTHDSTSWQKPMVEPNHHLISQEARVEEKRQKSLTPIRGFISMAQGHPTRHHLPKIPPPPIAFNTWTSGSLQHPNCSSHGMLRKWWGNNPPCSVGLSMWTSWCHVLECWENGTWQLKCRLFLHSWINWIWGEFETTMKVNEEV
jgi:hypothetical protein